MTTYHVVAGPDRELPVSLLTDPAYRAARPRIKRAVLLRFYGDMLGKTVHFSNERARQALQRLRLSTTHDLQVDLEQAIEKAGGWSAYLLSIKRKMDDAARQSRL